MNNYFKSYAIPISFTSHELNLDRERERERETERAEILLDLGGIFFLGSGSSSVTNLHHMSDNVGVFLCHAV